MTGFLLASAKAGGEQAAETAHYLFFVGPLGVTKAIVTMWAIMGIIVILGALAGLSAKRIPTGVQNVMEFALEGLEDLIAGVMDRERARAFLPLLGSFFLFILISNYSGLLPGSHEFFTAPTSRWGVTAGLAAVVFFSVQLFGLAKNGIYHFKHMVEPIYLAPLMLPLGIIEELVRPFSLSLRLVANISGGETVLFALAAAIPYFLPISTLLLELIFGFIQAFIFTILPSL
ncbi:MAG: F0F1 ATP synthase subunit A [Actinobacteria bacterium]|nr:F0F1 ATP synthase subunit A [Actinomycetota bacterium]